MSFSEELLNIANNSNLPQDYIKAGNKFILEDRYDLAAVAFQRAGEILISSSFNKNYLAANNFVKSAENFIKVGNYNLSYQLLLTAINIYLEDGKFATAAKQLSNLGDLYYQNKDLPLAIDSYEKSCKWFCYENSKSTGYSILYKVAELYIENKEYSKAIKFLIQIKEYYESNKLTKFKCKQLFLEILIIKLYINDDYLNFFITQEKHFSTREYKLIEGLINSLSNNDKELFRESVCDFNEIQPLNSWQSQMINEIETNIK